MFEFDDEQLEYLNYEHFMDDDYEDYILEYDCIKDFEELNIIENEIETENYENL